MRQTRPRSRHVTRLLVAFSAIGLASASSPSHGATIASVRLGFVRGPSILEIGPGGGRETLVLRGSDGRIFYEDPAWSSDGRRLAMTVTTFPTHAESSVFVVEGAKRIRVRGGPSSFDGRPSWSPSGQALVRVGYNRVEGGGLYIWNRALRGERELTPGEGPYDDAPAWSPDGTRIAFERISGGSKPRLYTIRPDGTGILQLTTTHATNPSWSPDGRRIAFSEAGRIVVVEATGRNRRYLTPLRSWSYDPAWSPDGRVIAFVRYPSRGSEDGDVWLMNADGTKQRVLVKDAYQPVWK